jgi:transcriptional regulator with XRE-family HTH domain
MKKGLQSGKRIKALRLLLGLKQAELAARVKVTQATVSSWELGDEKRGPSVEAYLRLAVLAPFPENLWFFEQGGFDPQAIVSVANEVVRERNAPAKRGEVIRIPRFRLTAGGMRKAGPAILLPAERVPNPTTTICAVLDEKTAGFAFSPGDLVLLDRPDREPDTLQPFLGQVVLVVFSPPSAQNGFRALRLPDKPFLGRLRCRENSFYKNCWEATLGPLMDPSIFGTVGEFWIVIGSWRDKGLPSDRPRLRVDRLSRAAAKIRLFPGCHILGRVIAWFPAPPEKK